MANKRNFLEKFQDITIVLNLGILADYLRTPGLPGRQRDDNIEISYVIVTTARSKPEPQRLHPNLSRHVQTK